MEDKGAAEKTVTKEGRTRGDNIPVDTFVGVATGTGGELDENWTKKSTAKTRQQPKKTRVDDCHVHPSEPHE